MLDIVAVGDYYAPVDDTTEAADLKQEVKQACRQRFRRIDRFTQLCLIGSSRCVEGISLAPETGLYIGSRFAAISNTINVQTQMIKHGQIPKPAHFINTLSNSAGYYVGRNLALEGKNLFISRADASTEAVLQMAQLDLQCQTADQILVGIVDEMPSPLSDHRQRLGVDSSTPLAEASHWLLLRRSTESNKKSEKTNCLSVIEEVKTLGSERDLIDWLTAIPEDIRRNGFIHYSSATASNTPDTLITAWPSYLTAMNLDMRYSPALTAGVLSHFVQNPSPGTATPATLITVHRDEDQRFHIIRVRKT
ncbi:hypothetical protein KOI40_01550 [Aestuariicella sp. G3-2]|uniref:beta-ketoacyl synthase N-terminal-like domain-containing protein n=1 Tax=Pseudomaricurvus albidus TaxID=2842452 RepID=UPI001C0DD94E|nr:beta-ketoacyl synthase N-terminal-like domain-containing protein [Aestuariicella albida]MBU3068480.1 hypothetical protein [Aestuariicella albida]